MFGSATLDIVIGLSMIYLFLSLICTSAMEWIAFLTGLRSNNLKKGIEKLLAAEEDPKTFPDEETRDSFKEEAKKILGKKLENIPDDEAIKCIETKAEELFEKSRLISKLYAHPLIKGLTKKKSNIVSYINSKERNPSYIPTKIFATALLDVMAVTNNLNANSTATTLKTNITNSPIGNEEIKKALIALVSNAEGKIDKAVENVEGWFDDGMERVSEWYKLKTHWFTLLFAIIVCFAFNADTIQIADQLSKDTTLRDAIVASATQIAKNECKEGNASECLEKNFNLDNLDLPLGWEAKRDKANEPDSFLEWIGHFYCNVLPSGWALVYKIIGIFISIMAVSLGAPFWFDALNKLVNIRSGGKRVEPKNKS